MSLLDLLPEIGSLSRHDKRTLFEWLAADLARGEEPPVIEADRTFPIWSPDRAFGAAAEMLRALEEDAKGPMVSARERIARP